MSSQKRVLIVEDNAPLAKLYKRSLERAGFQCEIVDTRHEAILLLQKKSFDAAIVDLQLRDDITHKGGIDVLEYIAAGDEKTAAFAVSASEEVRDAVRSHKVGAIEFVIKSDMESTDELVPRVQAVTARTKRTIFGDYDSLRAYLAAPDKTIFWDDQMRQTLGCSHPALQEGFSRAFNKYVPILRKNDDSSSFAADKVHRAVAGIFWSKQVGAPIWVCIYGPSGTAIPPPDRPQEGADHEDHYSGFNVKIWHLGSPPREQFVEFIRDTPWQNKGQG